MVVCGGLRRSTAHFSNDGAIEANGSINHSRQLGTTWVVLLNTFRGKSENLSRRKMDVYFIIKELSLLVVTIVDGEKKKHTLIW